MDALAQANDLRNQRSAVTHRILETQLALAKIRKAWLVDGQQTPISVRAGLDCDMAELELQRHTIDRELAGLDKIKREAYAATFQVRLLAALEERGLGDLVAEVRRSAAQEAPVFVDREDRSQPTQPGAPAAP
jgi:hypothetical protein